MKTIVPLILFISIFSVRLEAQSYDPLLGQAIQNLDQIIDSIDNDLLTSQIVAINRVSDVLNSLLPVNPSIWMYMNVPINPVTNVGDLTRDVLLPLIGFDCVGTPGPFGVQSISHEDLPYLLNNVHNTSTITWIQNQMEIDLSIAVGGYARLEETELYRQKQLEIVNERMEQVMAQEFSSYRFTNESKSWLKWLSVSHTNDVLFLYPGLNDDRDFTGGFRFELGTDKLKMRLFPGYLNSRNWYSYQSVFIGGEGYTPYLRDTCVFNSPTAVDSLDRPYASYQYYGRAKYRISRRGRMALKGEFKVGTIGKSSPGAIQALIHRDLVTTAVTPNGWESQIANGGRIAISYSVSGEVLLFRRGNIDHHWIYPSVLLNGTIGHDNTSGTFGVNFSNKSLKQRGGIDLDITEGRWLRCTWNVSSTVRYVQHNSMLDGYGIFGMAKDEDPDSPKDAYVLHPDSLNRLIWKNEFSVNIMFDHMGVFIKQSIWTPEFKKLEVKGETLPRYKNWSDWNHVGTIGFFWMI